MDVILEFYDDEEKLKKLPKKTAVLAGLFWSSGVAAIRKKAPSVDVTPSTEEETPTAASSPSLVSSEASVPAAGGAARRRTLHQGLMPTHPLENVLILTVLSHLSKSFREEAINPVFLNRLG